MTLDQLPRKVLADIVRDGLPDTFTVLEHQRSLGAIGGPVIQVLQQGFERIPEAPLSGIRVKFVVSIATPSTDEAQREDDLDRQVLALFVVLDAAPNVSISDAQKVLEDGYLSYDVTCSMIVTYTAG